MDGKKCMGKTVLDSLAPFSRDYEIVNSRIAQSNLPARIFSDSLTDEIFYQFLLILTFRKRCKDKKFTFKRYLFENNRK